MEFTLPEFPRCLAYLKKMRCRFEDSNWNNWWAAVLLSDNWSDEQLGRAGVSFETMQGSELLAIMEGLLRRGVKREVVKGEDNPLSLPLSLVAFLGSRGVITSRLQSEEDYWTAAKILWPQIKRKPKDGMNELEAKIKAIPKPQRGQANLNLYKMKKEWRVR
jgi:hypothetical protein